MGTLVAAPAEFRLSAEVDSPVTFGLVAPVVLLPERFRTLDARFQSAIACHELLHVRRRDWAHHLGEEVLRAVFWFHPAIAWLVSRVRLAREQIVDLEVVRLTEARKPYLESLLEFTNRSPITAIPAPPFLAERQLVERMALMLKEIRMSRKRLMASLVAISCCLVLVIALAAWTFPLLRAPRPAPSAGAMQENLGRRVPRLRRIEVRHHDFTGDVLSDKVANNEQTRLNQLPGRLTVETAYDQAKAGKMAGVFEDFWGERGITVEVRTTLTPYGRSARYANLQFDVYKQTILPGRLDGGIAGGVAEGVSGGVAEGIRGGISGPLSTHPSADEPSVDDSTIWLDTVKRGPMLRQVRGLGTLGGAEGSENLVAKVTLPAFLAAEVRPNQNATIDTRKGLVKGLKGHVTSLSPSSSDGTRTVTITLDAPLPPGFRAGLGAGQALEVVATLDVEKLDNVLVVGRPMHSRPNAAVFLYRITNNGSEAVRAQVKLGRASVTTMEVLDGLKEGDKVILSDMCSVGEAERVRITDDQHRSKH
jgi:BlaR1 peptidase M56